MKTFASMYVSGMERRHARQHVGQAVVHSISAGWTKIQHDTDLQPAADITGHHLR